MEAMRLAPPMRATRRATRVAPPMRAKRAASKTAAVMKKAMKVPAMKVIMIRVRPPMRKAVMEGPMKQKAMKVKEGQEQGPPAAWRPRPQPRPASRGRGRGGRGASSSGSRGSRQGG